MASLYNECGSVLLIVVCCLQFLSASCSEFEVGGENGSGVGGENGSWVVPKSKKDDQLYNQWASQHRFKVDDTLRFNYEKENDSVVVVNEEEYKKCKSNHPIFFSNNGDSVFKLDSAGLFYFISGVAGHCERGQKMIINVLEPPSPPPPPTTTPYSSHNHQMPSLAFFSPFILLI